MGDSKTILNDCLYFTANALARVITRMAEEEFRTTGLSPSHAFLMMLAIDNPGIGQKELCEHLQLAPSTVTRFVDAMVNRGFLSRQSEGKMSKIFPTAKGEDLHQPITDAWKSLHERYSRVLGRKEGDGLTVMIDAAYDKLNRAG